MALEQTLAKLKNAKDLKIVAIGDSLTCGWMVGRGYTAFLKDMLSVTFPGSMVQMVDKGMPGGTAAGGLSRVENQVIRHHPDLVIIQFAINDAFSGYTVAEFRENIIAMVSKIQNETSAEILLVTSGAMDDNDRKLVGRYYDALQDIAHIQTIPIAPVHEHWEREMKKGITFESLVQADGVHPTEAGHRLMAEAILNAIK